MCLWLPRVQSRRWHAREQYKTAGQCVQCFSWRFGPLDLAQAEQLDTGHVNDVRGVVDIIIWWNRQRVWGMGPWYQFAYLSGTTPASAVCSRQECCLVIVCHKTEHRRNGSVQRLPYSTRPTARRPSVVARSVILHSTSPTTDCGGWQDLTGCSDLDSCPWAPLGCPHSMCAPGHQWAIVYENERQPGRPGELSARSSLSTSQVGLICDVKHRQSSLGIKCLGEGFKQIGIGWFAHQLFVNFHFLTQDRALCRELTSTWSLHRTQCCLQNPIAFHNQTFEWHHRQGHRHSVWA